MSRTRNARLPAISSNMQMQQESRVTLPMSFREIVDEIVCFTDIPRLEVERRVWEQALVPGSNVLDDVRRFGVTPHEYNEQMLHLYRDGSGFIYETMVFWATPMRRRWTHQALERIRMHAERIQHPSAYIDVLILGDGAGNDSLFLASQGFRIHYFDVPGSKTYDFAMRRFDHYRLLGDRINLVPDYKSCVERSYDVVLSFEVLEHLPEPMEAIRDVSRMLKVGGIALITEDFGDVADHLPTHLRVNSNLAGTTIFRFLENQLVLSWYSHDPPFKPMEFRKVAHVTMADRWKLWSDFRVRGAYLARYVGSVTRRLHKLAYLGA